MIDRAASILPNKVSSLVAPIFWRYQSRQANRNYTSFSSGDITQQDRTADHIVILVIDAFRPDHSLDIPIDLSSAVAPSTWTFPSVTSLHTGRLPSEHKSFAHKLPEEDSSERPDQTSLRPHLVADMDCAGYDTYAGCAFVTPFLTLKGWYQTHRVYPDVRAEQVLSDYLSWREGRDSTFAYLHLGDLHAPINPPQRYTKKRNVDLSLPEIRHIRRYSTDFDENDPECRNYRKQKLALYRSAIDYLSNQISEFVKEVESDTILSITGDHGEAFWEHQNQDEKMTDSRPNYCFGHGGTPFDVISRVPAGIHTPTVGSVLPEGGRASLRDIPATISELVLENPIAPGRSWTDDIPTDRTVISEGVRYGVERKAAYQGKNKIIRSKYDGVTLPSRISDDGEKFVGLSEPFVDELLESLPDVWDDGVTTEDNRFVQDRLEALGYK